MGYYTNNEYELQLLINDYKKRFAKKMSISEQQEDNRKHDGQMKHWQPSPNISVQHVEACKQLDQAIGQTVTALLQVQQMIRANNMYHILQWPRNAGRHENQQQGPPWLYGIQPDLQ